jgi:Flp pilus assembly pilin Flp
VENCRLSKGIIPPATFGKIAMGNEWYQHGEVGNIIRCFLRLLSDEEGQDLIEYAIILSFVTLSVVGLFMGAGQDVKGVWAVSNNQLTKANVGAS